MVGSARTKAMTEPIFLPTPDGRSLDLYLADPAGGIPMLFHFGTPSSGLPFDPAVETFAGRGLRHVSFSRAGYGSSQRRPGRSVADVVDDVATVLDHIGAESVYVIGWSGRPHLLPEHGHLSLAVDSIPLILDELMAD